MGEITLFEQVEHSLKAETDSEKAVAMSAYMRDQFSFLGIPTPVRKKVVSTVFKDMNRSAIDWTFVFDCWSQPEREFQYAALSYLSSLKALLTQNDIPRLRELAVCKSWWDTIDGLDALIGGIALRYPEVNKTLLAWSLDDNFWLRRIAIDHQLSRKTKTDTALLEQIIVNNLGHKEFFINKAIGWSLREYSKTDPDWVRRFIDTYRDRLAPLSIREASKYL